MHISALHRIIRVFHSNSLLEGRKGSSNPLPPFPQLVLLKKGLLKVASKVVLVRQLSCRCEFWIAYLRLSFHFSRNDEVKRWWWAKGKKWKGEREEKGIIKRLKTIWRFFFLWIDNNVLQKKCIMYTRINICCIMCIYINVYSYKYLCLNWV